MATATQSPTELGAPYDQAEGRKAFRLRRSRPERSARVPATRRRRDGREPRLVLVGLALVLTCAAAGAGLAGRGTHASRYLTLSRSIPAGSILRPGDLTTASMSSPSGIAAIPMSEASRVIGSRVSETVVAGSLLVPGDLQQGTLPPAGSALVGTSLQPDQVPVGLQVGDEVLVVLGGTLQSAPQSSGPSQIASSTPGGSVNGSGPTVLGRGSVFSVGGSTASSANPGNGTGVLYVTVETGHLAAPSIAAASASGNVSLVEISAASTRLGRGAR